MKNRILIKYATRGRPEWFKKAIMNIYETIFTHDFLILISGDNDDKSMCNPEIDNFLNLLPKNKGEWQMEWWKSTSKISAINRDMAYSGDWDILINMSDDMNFIVPGWDQVMINRIREVWGDSLDFFAHFNDGYVKEALPTMSIMGRTYYERDNYIYYPEYKSFSCDAEAMYVAMFRGKHHYFSDNLFLHQHPTHSPMPNDNTYAVNSLATPHDVALYWRRLNSNFGLGENIGPTPWDEWKGKQPKE